MDSQVGVLKESLGLSEIIEKGVLFPCHLQLKAVTGSENTGVEQYIAEKDTFKVCRGLIESSFISGLHMYNPVWTKLYAQLDELNPESHDNRTNKKISRGTLMLNKDANPEAIERYNNNLAIIEKELNLIDVEYKLQEGTVEVTMPKGRIIIGSNHTKVDIHAEP